MSHFGSVYSMDERALPNMFMDPMAPHSSIPNSTSLSFEFDNFGVAPQPATSTLPMTPQLSIPTTQPQVAYIQSTQQPDMQQMICVQRTENVSNVVQVENHSVCNLQSQSQIDVPQSNDCTSPSLEQVQDETTDDPSAEAPEIDIAINNVVCSFATKCHLNLRRIAMEGMHVIMKKESGMVSMKLRNPYTTASIWSSGKITCTGATSEDESKRAARRFARTLQKLGFKTKVTNFRVVNVLGTCSLPFAINIAEFSRHHPREASYEPELHPGVTYRIKEPKATLKVFSTGSITVTAPRVANVQGAIEHIFPLVYPFHREKAQLKEKDLSDANLYIIPGNMRKRHVVEQQRQLVYKRQRFDESDEEDWTDTDDDLDSDDSFE